MFFIAKNIRKSLELGNNGWYICTRFGAIMPGRFFSWRLAPDFKKNFVKSFAGNKKGCYICTRQSEELWTLRSLLTYWIDSVWWRYTATYKLTTEENELFRGLVGLLVVQHIKDMTMKSLILAQDER